MTDEQITQAARAICADQCEKQDNSDGQLYRSGGWVIARLFKGDEEWD